MSNHFATKYTRDTTEQISQNVTESLDRLKHVPRHSYREIANGIAIALSAIPSSRMDTATAGRPSGNLNSSELYRPPNQTYLCEWQRDWGWPGARGIWRKIPSPSYRGVPAQAFVAFPGTSAEAVKIPLLPLLSPFASLLTGIPTCAHTNRPQHKNRSYV